MYSYPYCLLYMPFLCNYEQRNRKRIKREKLPCPIVMSATVITGIIFTFTIKSYAISITKRNDTQIEHTVHAYK